MKGPLTRGLVAGLVLAGACDSGNEPPLPQASSLRVLHTIRGGPSLTVYVDGVRGSTLGFGNLSKTVFLSPGPHDLVLVPADTTHSLIAPFTAVEGVGYSVFAIDSTSGATHTIEPVFVVDTGAVASAGHALLRLASYAAAAPAIDASRSQPDSAGLLVSAQPLNFRGVTRYFDGPPGAWSVVISHSGVTDTLLATGPISLSLGQARTVAVLDSTAGHVTWRLVPDRN